MKTYNHKNNTKSFNYRNPEENMKVAKVINDLLKTGKWQFSHVVSDTPAPYTTIILKKIKELA